MVYSNEELEERRKAGGNFLRSGPRDPRRVLRGLSVITAVIAALNLLAGAVSVNVGTFALAVLGLALALLYWLFSRVESPGPVLFAVTVGVAVGRALIVLLSYIATKGASVQTLVLGLALPLWLLVIAVRAMVQIQRTATATQ